jgi:uncharacterized protein
MKPTALITGGSSGIGRVFAERFATDGHDLILVARNQDRLDATASDLQRRYSSDVRTISADLSQIDQIERLGAEIYGLSNLDILVNSAGFGVPGGSPYEDSKEHQEMIHAHIAAPVCLCHKAVPKMKDRERGTIINVSSLAGLLPGGGVYSATKNYLTKFSCSLQAEVAGDGIKVQALCPGYTHTGFHITQRYKDQGFKKKWPWLWMSAEEVVDISLKSLKDEKVICIPGFKNRLIHFLAPSLHKIISALRKK